MSSPTEPSSLCSVHSIHSCTGFLNERLAALGLSPKLLLPFEGEEPLRRKKPLAERNAEENDQSARLTNGDGTERALAEALNVIFDLVKELERQPYKAQYYAEQVRALRTETESQHASAERLREEKHQLRADYGKLKQLAEREREQHRRAIEAASRELEVLRRQNAELSVMKWKAEGQVRQLQAELAQLRRHVEKKYESASGHGNAFPRRSTQAQATASSSSLEAARSLSRDGAEHMYDQNDADTFLSAHSVKGEKRAFKQQRKMRETELVSHETGANPASGEPGKFNDAPKNEGQTKFAGNELVHKEQHHEATEQTITTEVEALRRECEWLRHQLDWYRGIVSEQEELLAYAIDHR